ncbi:MAG: hypothetical protein ABF384_14710 [Verrucomicrobiales bacterium]
MRIPTEQCVFEGPQKQKRSRPEQSRRNKEGDDYDRRKVSESCARKTGRQNKWKR